ncbi:MAG: hypothetical protein WCJ09_00965 [Planctomycetota bacterium]
MAGILAILSAGARPRPCIRTERALLCDHERFLVTGTPIGNILTWDLNGLLMPKPKE